MLHFQNEKMDKADILEETVKFVRSSRAKGTIDHSYLKKKFIQQLQLDMLIKLVVTSFWNIILCLYHLSSQNNKAYKRQTAGKIIRNITLKRQLQTARQFNWHQQK